MSQPNASPPDALPPGTGILAATNGNQTDGRRSIGSAEANVLAAVGAPDATPPLSRRRKMFIAVALAGAAWLLVALIVGAASALIRG